MNEQLDVSELDVSKKEIVQKVDAREALQPSYEQRFRSSLSRARSVENDERQRTQPGIGTQEPVKAKRRAVPNRRETREVAKRIVQKFQEM